jgi:hypothetical protein
MYAVLIDSLLHLYQFWGDASWMNGPRQIRDLGRRRYLSYLRWFVFPNDTVQPRRVCLEYAQLSYKKT